MPTYNARLCVNIAAPSEAAARAQVPGYLKEHLRLTVGGFLALSAEERALSKDLARKAHQALLEIAAEPRDGDFTEAFAQAFLHHLDDLNGNH